MRAVILVPRRADPERDELWRFCRGRWVDHHPDWPIFEGHDEGPGAFNRSAAINRAAELAGDWDTALIIDADVVTHPPAVRQGVKLAHDAQLLVITHDERVMLNRNGTRRVLGGYAGSWRERNMVERTWSDSVSCSVAVPRALWDAVGGFDPLFVGWGYEDTAFRIACETVSDTHLVRIAAECFHLWHASPPDARKDSPYRKANEERRRLYERARFDVARLEPLLMESRTAASGATTEPTRIPRIIHRTVPSLTSAEVEAWWAQFETLHPGWDLRTYREPIDPNEWPLTADLWPRCQNGAQKAGLIRLEALVTHGGIYVDSDVEPLRSFEPLLTCSAFAGWEDETTVPDAVLGAEPKHPAFIDMLAAARLELEAGGDAWATGPGITTGGLPGRSDVLLLPPGAFYPYHYLQKAAKSDAPGPWVFARHHWHGSWLDASRRQSIQARQR